LRRVHFFISDEIESVMRRLEVSSTERRVLDALNYSGGQVEEEGIDVSTICDLVGVPIRHQTVASTLKRMVKEDLVAHTGPIRIGVRRGTGWRITERGQRLRTIYKGVAEAVLSAIYRYASDEQFELLSDAGGTMVSDTDERHRPLLQSAAFTVVGDQPMVGRDWSTVRRGHVFINNRIMAELIPMGVDASERRVMDTLAFARHCGVTGGLPKDVIARLNSALSKSTMTTVMRRLVAAGWVEDRMGRWTITENGDAVRDRFKAIAEKRIRENWDLTVGAQGDAASLGQLELLQGLVGNAHRVRIETLVPVLDRYVSSVRYDRARI